MTDKPKRPRDASQLAKFIVDVATGEASDDQPEKAKGQRKGGLKGGKARAEKLSAEARRDIAKKAASARWSEKQTEPWLEISGVEVGGANPQNVVSSMLSKSPEFISHGRSGWTLAVPDSHETEKADDAAPGGDTSSALFENRPSQQAEPQAKGREAVPGGGT